MSKEKQTSLNGYTLAQRLRAARKVYALSATSQALYYELGAVCNDQGKGEVWPEVFRVRNQDLWAAVSVTENTLIKARKELVDAELISYKSGKSTKEPCDYSFYATKFKACTTSNFAVVEQTTAETTAGTTAEFTSKSEGVTTSKFDDSNTQTSTVHPREKLEQKHFVPNGTSADGAGDEKKVGPQKKSEATSSPRPPSPEIVMPWASEAFGEKWKLWKEYKREQHRFTYRPIGEQSALHALAEKADGEEGKAIEIITHSMGNGYSGLFPPKQYSNGKQSNGTHQAAGGLNADHKRELAERMARLSGQGR